MIAETLARLHWNWLQRGTMRTPGAALAPAAARSVTKVTPATIHA